MTIWVLAGTTEGRYAAVRLREAGQRVVVTTATDYGRELLLGRLGRREGLKVESGPLDVEGMIAFIEANGVRAVVDATHPFAVQASMNARNATARCGVPFVRFERRCEVIEYDALIEVDGFEEAAEKAVERGPRVFLAIGVKNLRPFAEKANEAGVDLAVRILPNEESISVCKELGIPLKNVVAAVGPFSVEFNRACFREFGASVVVTKESGREGGYAEKVEAAKSLGVPVISVKRPRIDVERVFDYEGLVAFLEGG